MRRIALPLILGLTGCLTTGVLQTAETAGKDNLQFAFEPGVVGIADGNGNAGVLPSFNVAARYGVSERTDIGGRFGTSLIELHVKTMFTEPNPDELQVAFAPHLGGFFASGGGGGAGLFWLKLPVLFDIPVGEHDLILGPGARVIGVLGGGGGGGSAGGGILLLGSSIGFGARIGERARLIPEFGIEYPIVGAAAAGGDGITGGLGGGAVFSFQLGVVLGGRSKGKEM
ncbi:MAG: hypothetical protein AB8H79_12710 [Myxococcota bacterium]